MTVMTTLAEFARDPRKHIELVDGEIIVSPNAGRPHFNVTWKLVAILHAHGLVLGIEANLVLDDSNPMRPLVREPDVYVLREENGPEDDGLFQYAANTLLAVEIVSPGSGITDWIEKMSEYADAGIEHYWIVDHFSDGSPQLYTFRLRQGGYGEREHWNKEVDIEVAGVRVQFDVRDLAWRDIG
jgi:Uma2 family endonuclease